MKNNKINIKPWLFSSFVSICSVIIIIYIIDMLSALISDARLQYFIDANSVSAETASSDFKINVILQLLILTLPWFLFIFYSYLAINKLKIGNVFILFWSAIFIINIAGQFSVVRVEPLLWVKIIVTISSVVGIGLLFTQFMNLIRISHYKNLEERWGGGRA